MKIEIPVLIVGGEPVGMGLVLGLGWRGVGYTLRHLPAGIDLLKLDCEGAEYHLLADPRFLAHLAPAEIHMEYHRGHAPVVSLLDRAGYVVAVEPASGPVGLLAAKRRR